MFHAVVHHAHHSSPTIFKFFSLSTSICLCIYILYICIGNNRKYNYIMNIQAFVRGGNAVVVNKKSHGLHYTPIHETIVPVGSSNRPVLYTCVFCALCVWLLYLHFYSSCRTYTGANRRKEIKKKRIGKTTLFVPSSIFVVVVILFPLFLFIFTDNGKESLVFDRRKTTLTSIGKDEVVLTRTMKAAEAVMLPFIRFLKSPYSINRFSHRVCEVIYIHT